MAMAIKRRLSIYLVTAIIVSIGCSALFAGNAVGESNDYNAALVGTYLATITNSKGEFSSQSTIEFGADRTMSVVDSNQIDIGFTDSQGSWAWERWFRTFTATTLNFFPDDNFVARTDYKGRLNKEGVQGRIVLRFFGPGEDPLRDVGSLGGVFSFTAERILP